MIPYTLVLKPGLVVYRIYNGYWFWGARRHRPLARSARRDKRNPPRLDLSAPGLREAWSAGDHSQFHGWNKNPQ